MKSHIKSCGDSEVIKWHEIVFDFDELMSALLNNNIPDLVKEVLSNDYQKYIIMPLLIADISKSVLLGLIQKIKEGNPNRWNLVVLACGDIAEKMELEAKRLCELYKIDSQYWIGEK